MHRNKRGADLRTNKKVVLMELKMICKIAIIEIVEINWTNLNCLIDNFRYFTYNINIDEGIIGFGA